MLILALECSTAVAGVALLKDGVIIKEVFSNYKKNHSETLLPVIDRSLSECQYSLQDVSAVAVTIGPGSFTGLRIGLATAKGLCTAAARPLIAIPTLEVLAHNIAYNSFLAGTALDARKKQVYMCVYDVSGGQPSPLAPVSAVSPEIFVDNALELLHIYGKHKIMLLGDGAVTYQKLFENSFNQRMIMAPSHLLWPRAAALAELASIKFAKKEFENSDLIKPLYIRRSEAEIRLSDKECIC
ncbi:MAG: tRNA (adenosine(37)-N6)-threonylcarbamoyltransferase complex dimerization subunit type 1 TsaB [Syntrophomonadaceae bacterium]|jgi:tRNA threonylcarbamoyladenosine biosynthesis protein TsaB|nr:tRNA (adenosine(37)-N6)-threonylcarbamoyltransferase complex dimerization subunit type 1 TsaB [Syntrophomonadaceae bacterium]